MMANRTLFGGSSGVTVKPADTVNRAGGKAYKLSNAAALCQYVATSTFNGTYYSSAADQLSAVQNLVEGVPLELVAKAAIYGHEKARMKDVPAYLLAVLAAKGRIDLLRKAWPRVITNVKMLLNFVQIVRSGVTGRKSFGTAVKKLIQEWIISRNGDSLFFASIGHSNPSLEDVIKMVHPHPKDEAQNDILAYVLGKLTYDAKTGYWVDAKGKEWEKTLLPERVVQLAKFKHDNSLELPDVEFRTLTNCDLTPEHWKQIGLKMPWNTLRMNLNMLLRNGVFKDSKVTQQLAKKLGDANEVRKNNVFPYQLLTAYQNIEAEVPQVIQLALQDALEVATENVPDMGNVAVCPDLSGSMGSPITGNRGSVTSKTTCSDVATLVAAAVARKNPAGTTVVAWADSAQIVKFNPRDSIITNAQIFKNLTYRLGGGTNITAALAILNRLNWKGDAVVLLTDMESWLDPFQNTPRYNYGYMSAGGTGLAQEWATLKKRNPKAKLIGINLQASSTTQIPDNKDVMNIGGFSDSVFTVMSEFIKNGDVHFVDVVDNYVNLNE